MSVRYTLSWLMMLKEKNFRIHWSLLTSIQSTLA